jgi:hypothetical protein
MVCTFLLFLSTWNDTGKKFLVAVYILKNLAVLGIGVYTIVRLVKLKINPKMAIDSELGAVISVAFDVLLNLYFTLIALFHAFEAEEDEEDDIKKPKS